jgi:SAM-dependent methyltransferase
MTADTLHAAPADRVGHDGSFDHGWISRVNAWFFTAFARQIDEMSDAHKTAAFSGIAPGVVVELGAGTGANFARLPAGTTLHAVEPSRAMHPGLIARAAAAGIDLRLHASGAEHVDLPDASVDEVLCSLVLCTVNDPDAVLAEVRRVLRPGGRFRFVEHVAASGIRGAVQRAVRRPWAWVFEGCDAHRDTAAAVRDAGFDDVIIERRMFRRSPFWVVNTAIWGIATR